MVKQRSDLKKDRISGKGQIFLSGEEIGKVEKIGKMMYGSIKHNIKLEAEEFIKIGKMMMEK